MFFRPFPPYTTCRSIALERQSRQRKMRLSEIFLLKQDKRFEIFQSHNDTMLTHDDITLPHKNLKPHVPVF